MRFALLIWDIMGGIGGDPSPSSVSALNEYLEALRAEGMGPQLQTFAIAPTARWTDGEPYDAVVKGRGPRRPSFDPVDVYRNIELSRMITLRCDDEDLVLLWAPRYPFIASVEVRRILDDDSADFGLDYSALLEIARGHWSEPVGIASERTDDIIWHHPDLIPELLRALAETAPPGQLHMIGVGELESISIHAEGVDAADQALEYLIAANLPAEVMLEILSGPWPHYLEKWSAAERLKGILSDEQCAEIAARYRRD